MSKTKATGRWLAGLIIAGLTACALLSPGGSMSTFLSLVLPARWTETLWVDSRAYAHPPPGPYSLTINLNGGVNEVKGGMVLVWWLGEELPRVFIRDQSRNDFPATLTFEQATTVTLWAWNQASSDLMWGFIEWQGTEPYTGYDYPDMRSIVPDFVLSGEATITAVFMACNVRIFDGLNGNEVSESVEETRGAFTVANRNNTNAGTGNTTPDWDENPVANEVDLMKVVFEQPMPGATAVALDEAERLEVTMSTSPGRFWTSADKTALFVVPWNARLVNIPTNPVWIEGEHPSSELREGSVSFGCTVKGDSQDPRRRNSAGGDLAKYTFIKLVSAHVVHDASPPAAWSDNPTPPIVAHNQGVALRAVVNIMPSIESKSLFWGFDDGSAQLGGNPQTVYNWAQGFWGRTSDGGLGWNVTVNWKDLMPYTQHQDGASNDPGASNYPQYTNVDTDTTLWLGSNGHWGRLPVEGDTYDIIEYQQIVRAGQWEVEADSDVGTRRYRISDCYVSGPGGAYSPGKQDLATVSNLVYEGTDDAYDRGVKSTVTRIRRRSDHASNYVSYIEAYRQVPWIYGSAGVPAPTHQTERFIGFDCADLVVGGARAASLTNMEYTNAQDLTGLPVRGPYNDIYKIESGVVKRTSDGQPANIVIGTGADDLHIGDVIVFNSDGVGNYNHAVALYHDDGDSMLDGPDTVIEALSGNWGNWRNGVNSTRTLNLVCLNEAYRFVVRQGW